MPFTLTMPKLSPTMEGGTIVKWHKKIGDAVEPGDVLLEAATDKAVVEYQAIDAGWMRKILVEEGQEATVNQPIAILTEEKNESIEGYKLPVQTPPAKPEEEKVEENGKGEAVTSSAQNAQSQSSIYRQPIFVPEPPLESYQFDFAREKAGERVKASPLAKKIAKEQGLDISSITGSGPHQRIMSRDLEKAQPVGKFAAGRRESPKELPGSYEEVSLTPMRKVIGQRLQESKSFIPHFYVRQEVDAKALFECREQLKNGEIKATINDFIIRACAITLSQHMDVNRGFNSSNQSMVQFKTVDIAVAVGIEGGLITPIIRHADYKSVGEIGTEMRSLAQKAKEGKLEAHEYKGGSFTISNLGMYGITDFQAIINPPQAAILAVSAIQEAAIVKNGALEVGKLMNLTLSVDHRVIDGVVAATFLRTLKKYLENPSLLLF